MNLSKLSFPLTVDFGNEKYWIGDEGPFKYGEAVTAYFCGKYAGAATEDYTPLMQELEEQLLTFGSHLEPYAKDQAVDIGLFSQPERHAVNCFVCVTVHHVERGEKIVTERRIEPFHWCFLVCCVLDSACVSFYKSVPVVNTRERQAEGSAV